MSEGEQPDWTDKLPLTVGFAVHYLDGVMQQEHPEICQQWKTVRSYLLGNQSPLNPTTGAAPLPPNAVINVAVLQEDLSEMLRVLGLGDHARPQSPHEVFLECIAEVKRLKAERPRLPDQERAKKTLDAAFRDYAPLHAEAARRNYDPKLSAAIENQIASLVTAVRAEERERWIAWHEQQCAEQRKRAEHSIYAKAKAEAHQESAKAMRGED
jgi:hypothetical protein